MQVNSLQATQPATEPASTTPSAPTDLGKDDFLKLLVTQLEYQDPMDPVSNEEFIAQTAQFSALEQMQNLNATMTDLMALQRATGNAVLVGYIGKSVEVPGTSIELKGGSAVLGVTLEDAAQVTLEIQDAEGQVIRILESGEILSPNDYRFVWDGRDEDGQSVPEGIYWFTPTSVAPDGSAVDVQPFVTGKVAAILYENNMPQLLVNDELVDPTAIRAVEDGLGR